MSAAGINSVGDPVLRPLGHVQWSAIFAGAVAAAGLSFALNAFATGIGLSIVSTAPTWREASSWLALISGLYFLFVALLAFALGGYIAGRLRAPLNLSAGEMEFRDGIHGLITWGLAVIFTAIFALATAFIAAKAIEPQGGGQAQSVAGENIIASELDELFRADRLPAGLTYRRAEAARILLKASGHRGVPAADRQYLSMIVGTSAGLSMEEAQGRVDREIAAAKDELHKARVAAVLQAFFIAVALFAGAAVAWFAACEGGRERERGTYPIWDWSFRRR
jgi:hypothetical protein